MFRNPIPVILMLVATMLVASFATAIISGEWTLQSIRGARFVPVFLLAVGIIAIARAKPALVRFVCEFSSIATFVLSLNYARLVLKWSALETPGADVDAIMAGVLSFACLILAVLIWRTRGWAEPAPEENQTGRTASGTGFPRFAGRMTLAVMLLAPVALISSGISPKAAVARAVRMVEAAPVFAPRERDEPAATNRDTGDARSPRTDRADENANDATRPVFPAPRDSGVLPTAERRMIPGRHSSEVRPPLATVVGLRAPTAVIPANRAVGQFRAGEARPLPLPPAPWIATSGATVNDARFALLWERHRAERAARLERRIAAQRFRATDSETPPASPASSSVTETARAATRENPADVSIEPSTPAATDPPTATTLLPPFGLTGGSTADGTLVLDAEEDQEAAPADPIEDLAKIDELDHALVVDDTRRPSLLTATGDSMDATDGSSSFEPVASDESESDPAELDRPAPAEPSTVPRDASVPAASSRDRDWPSLESGPAGLPSTDAPTGGTDATDARTNRTDATDARTSATAPRWGRSPERPARTDVVDQPRTGWTNRVPAATDVTADDETLDPKPSPAAPAWGARTPATTSDTEPGEVDPSETESATPAAPTWGTRTPATGSGSASGGLDDPRTKPATPASPTWGTRTPEASSDTGPDERAAPDLAPEPTAATDRTPTWTARSTDSVPKPNVSAPAPTTRTWNRPAANSDSGAEPRPVTRTPSWTSSSTEAAAPNTAASEKPIDRAVTPETIEAASTAPAVDRPAGWTRDPRPRALASEPSDEIPAPTATRDRNPRTVAFAGPPAATSAAPVTPAGTARSTHESAGDPWLMTPGDGDGDGRSAAADASEATGVLAAIPGGVWTTSATGAAMCLILIAAAWWRLRPTRTIGATALADTLAPPTGTGDAGSD